MPSRTAGGFSIPATAGRSAPKTLAGVLRPHAAAIDRWTTSGVPRTSQPRQRRRVTIVSKPLNFPTSQACTGVSESPEPTLIYGAGVEVVPCGPRPRQVPPWRCPLRGVIYGEPMQETRFIRREPPKMSGLGQSVNNFLLSADLLLGRHNAAVRLRKIFLPARLCVRLRFRTAISASAQRHGALPQSSSASRFAPILSKICWRRFSNARRVWCKVC
jgi:hypothetical protein